MTIAIVTCIVILLIGSKRAMEYFLVFTLCYFFPPVILIAIITLVVRHKLKSK